MTVAAGGFAAIISPGEIVASIGDLHFHDLRGTAAIKFYVAGLSERVVAEIIEWGARLHIVRYVDRTAATRAIIVQLNRCSEYE